MRPGPYAEDDGGGHEHGQRDGYRSYGASADSGQLACFAHLTGKLILLEVAVNTQASRTSQVAAIGRLWWAHRRNLPIPPLTVQSSLVNICVIRPVKSVRFCRSLRGD